MKIIGLTGGIGSGKSTVSEFLTKKGFQIIDADKIAREIAEPGSDILTVLSDAFGKEIIRDDGSLNRKLLGSIAFSDPDKGHMLNEIMHGRILEIIKQRIADYEKEMLHLNYGQKAVMQSRAETLFIDAPLLLESGLCKMVHEIWVVDAEDEIRIRRIMDRDSLSREEIQNRIDRQMPREEKLQKADEVLDNSRSREDLYDQIEKLIEKL